MKLQLKREVVRGLMHAHGITYKEVALALGLKSGQAAFRMVENGSPKHVEGLAIMFNITDPEKTLVRIVKNNGGDGDD